jgi:nitrate/nitrite transport system permease protein
MWALVGTAAAVAGWSAATMAAPDLPKPAAAARELATLLRAAFVDNGPNDKGVALQLLASLQRVGVGFAVAAIVGVLIGMAMGTSPRIWKAVNPIVNFLRPVSPLAWFPLWLVALKDAPRAAIWVIFVTALWPTILNTAAGAASVPVDQRNVARVFQFGRRAYFRHIVVPHTLPSVVTGLRLSMGVSWMVIVAVEMLSGGTGIGSFVWESYNGGSLPRVVAAIALIGAVGLALDAAFLRIASRVALPEARA